MQVPPFSDLVSKRALLDQRLRALGRTLIAYSGGVDSAFLAWASHQILGRDMLAVIADSTAWRDPACRCDRFCHGTRNST